MGLVEPRVDNKRRVGDRNATCERDTDQLAAGSRGPNADGLAEYAALRNEATERISMVSEQGFSAAIAMFAIFSLFVGLAYSDLGGVPFLLVDSFLLALASAYLFLAALKSGENIRQVVKIATYCEVFYERESDGLQWERFLERSGDGSSLLKDRLLQACYNKEYVALAALSILAYFMNMAIWAMGGGCEAWASLRCCWPLVAACAIGSAVLLFLTWGQTSAKKNYADYRASCTADAEGFWLEVHPDAVLSVDARCGAAGAGEGPADGS